MATSKNTKKIITTLLFGTAEKFAVQFLNCGTHVYTRILFPNDEVFDDWDQRTLEAARSLWQHWMKTKICLKRIDIPESEKLDGLSSTEYVTRFFSEVA